MLTCMDGAVYATEGYGFLCLPRGITERLAAKQYQLEYPAGTEVSMPAQEDVVSILNKIRILGANTQKKGSDHDQLNRIVTWYSRRLTGAMAGRAHQDEPEGGVALSAPIIRAYLSLRRSCKKCIYDCKGKSI